MKECEVAVYLGALTLAPTSTSSVVGSILGFLGIFAPGLILAFGFQSLWVVIRSRSIVIALIRGINVAAVGLVFTAVYRLWQIGYLTPSQENGMSLGAEPWWVVQVIAVLHEYGMVWSGDVGGDCRKCFIRSMLVRRGEAMVRMHVITQMHTGSQMY